MLTAPAPLRGFSDQIADLWWRSDQSAHDQIRPKIRLVWSDLVFWHHYSAVPLSSCSPMRGKQRTPFYPPYFKAVPLLLLFHLHSLSLMPQTNCRWNRFTLWLVQWKCRFFLLPLLSWEAEERNWREREKTKRRHETTSEPVFLSPSLFLSSFFSLSHFLKFVPWGQRSARGNSSKRERERLAERERD